MKTPASYRWRGIRRKKPVGTLWTSSSQLECYQGNQLAAAVPPTSQILSLAEF